MGERVFPVLYLNQTFGFYRLCGSQCLTVLFFLYGRFRIYQVQFQVFLVSFTVPIDVEKQTYVAVR